MGTSSIRLWPRQCARGLSNLRNARDAMIGWMQIYQNKVTTAEKAVRAVESGMRLYLTGNCSVPQRVMAAVVEYAPAFEKPIEIVQMLTVGSADYVAPGMEKYICVNTTFISPNVR